MVWSKTGRTWKTSTKPHLNIVMPNFGNVTCTNKMSIRSVGNFERFPLNALRTTNTVHFFVCYLENKCSLLSAIILCSTFYTCFSVVGAGKLLLSLLFCWLLVVPLTCTTLAFTGAKPEHNLVLVWTSIWCSVCNICIPLWIALTGKVWMHISKSTISFPATS